MEGVSKKATQMTCSLWLCVAVITAFGWKMIALLFAQRVANI